MTPEAFRQPRPGEKTIQLAIRLGLLAFLIYWTFILIEPFIPILAWSIVLTVALYGPFRWLSDRLGDRPTLAAVLITILSLAIIFGPVIWLGLGFADWLRGFAGQVASGTLVIPSPPAEVKNWPVIGAYLHELWEQASSNLSSALGEVAPHLKPMAVPLLAFAGSAGVGMLKFIVAVLLSGLMLPFGPRLLDAMQRVQARLLPDRNEDLAALAGVTIRSVAQGVIGVAAVQAVLAGIGLKVAGIPSAGVLAFGVLILCILQIGATVILVPIVIWVWTSKDFTFTPALVLTIYLAVVGVADNVLKPIVMGRGLSTPVMVIFVGVLGGTLAHGIVGLFVGPIVLAVAWQLAMAWIRQDKAGAVANTAELNIESEGKGSPTGSTAT